MAGRRGQKPRILKSSSKADNAYRLCRKSNRGKERESREGKCIRNQKGGDREGGALPKLAKKQFKDGVREDRITRTSERGGAGRKNMTPRRQNNKKPRKEGRKMEPRHEEVNVWVSDLSSSTLYPAENVVE